MSNPQKNKGTRLESTVRDYLRSVGIPAERMPAGAKLDRGDLAGIPGWTVECKSYRNLAEGIRIGLADLEREQANADTPYGCVVLKRPRIADPGRQIVVMELWQWAALLQMQEGYHHLLHAHRLTNNPTGGATA